VRSVISYIILGEYAHPDDNIMLSYSTR